MQKPNRTIRDHFGRLNDPRRRHRRRHLLLDIITIAICAVIAGANDWQQIATFGRCRFDWLKRFLSLPNGIPSHDTFQRVFELLQPGAFQACFRGWMRALAENLGLQHIAIDGKTLRGSRTSELGPLHLVSAWATANHLSLGQEAVAHKSNEITAIPKLLELLDIEGVLITIDAMGCQKDIAAAIVERGGDYVLTVKENQECLLNDIRETVGQALDGTLPAAQVSHHTTRERGHGRQEVRTYTVVHNVEGVQDRELWRSLSSVGMCYSERTVNGQTSTETRYFIGSRRMNAKRYGAALRNHWGVENSLHWQLDVTFREDDNRTQGRHAADNFSLLRRLALVLLKQHPSTDSIAKKRYQAALDVGFLEQVLLAESKMGNR